MHFLSLASSATPAQAAVARLELVLPTGGRLASGCCEHEEEKGNDRCGCALK